MPRERVGEHEAADAVAVRDREAHRGPAAHRLADDVRALDLEVIEDREQIVRSPVRGFASPWRFVDVAEAALVPRDRRGTRASNTGTCWYQIA